MNLVTGKGLIKVETEETRRLFHWCLELKFELLNESSAKASFYGRMIISMILIISIFQSLAASARTAGAQKARTVGVYLLCSPLYSIGYTHL